MYDEQYSISEVKGNKDLILRYDIYGNITNTKLTQEDKTFGYNTLEYTPQNNLTYIRARYYDSSTGTFISKDTYLGNIYKPITTNRYAYCSGDPINNTDQDGHLFGLIAAAIAIAVVVVAVISKPSTSTTKTNPSSGGGSSYKGNSGGGNTNGNKGGGSKGYSGGGSSGGYSSDGWSSYSSNESYYSPPPPDPRQYYYPLVTGPYAVNNSGYYYTYNELNNSYSIKDLAHNNVFYSSDSSLLYESNKTYSETSKQTASAYYSNKQKDGLGNSKNENKGLFSSAVSWIDNHLDDIAAVGAAAGVIALTVAASFASCGAIPIIAGISGTTLAGFFTGVSVAGFTTTTLTGLTNIGTGFSGTKLTGEKMSYTESANRIVKGTVQTYTGVTGLYADKQLYDAISSSSNVNGVSNDNSVNTKKNKDDYIVNNTNVDYKAEAKKVDPNHHGNSLETTRTNFGYKIVDNNTKEVIKYGETLNPSSRYTINYYESNNAHMEIDFVGSKTAVHNWQHDMNIEYYYNHNETFPSGLAENNKGW